MVSVDGFDFLEELAGLIWTEFLIEDMTNYFTCTKNVKIIYPPIRTFVSRYSCCEVKVDMRMSFVFFKVS